MKGFLPLILGIFGTFAFSWAGLTFIPNLQFGQLEPQMDEEGNDAYPAPKSGMAERGRQVYAANGCVYCHTQQVRADYAGSDIERKWGERRSAPRDYIFDRPALIGKMRTGPDLANIGKRAPVEDDNASPAPAASPTAAPTGNPPAPGAPASVSPPQNAAANPSASAPPKAGAPTPPATNQVANAPAAMGTTMDSAPTTKAPVAYSAAWHHQHLYNPRSLVSDSNMPSYRFLYETRPVGSQPAADAVKITSKNSAPLRSEIVPTYDAKCLVAYLMSLDQSHPLKEVKSSAPAPAPAKGAK